MKKGKHLGEFSFKAVTFRVLPLGRVEINLEGQAVGVPQILQTVTGTLGAGPFSGNFAAITDAGESIYGTLDGKSEPIKNGKFRTTMVVHRSDNTTVIAEGEVNRPERSWTGKVYEATE